MFTPILTKGQLKQSLSAQKERPAKGLRNILAQPFENYWPTVNVDQYPTLITHMNELFPLIKRSTFKIPGSKLRLMSKEERILSRKEALEKATTKPDENLLKSVILGINAVTRALEKNDVCCVLLEANVDPSLLIKHIITMAQNKKVPVLLLSILKTITLEKIGFATAALALKNDVMRSSENAFHPLYRSIAEVSKNFKSPKCSLKIFKPDETAGESADCNPTPNISEQEKRVVFTDVYKYRTSRKERTFIPPSINKTSQISETPSDEFIALNSNLVHVTDKTCTDPLKNERYVNIHKVKKENESTEENNIKSLNNAEENIKFLDKSKLDNNNTESLKYTKHYIPKKRKNDDVTYLPLKIKCVQGNSNRKKATKFAKKKKK